ncbi:hypothetical protein AYO39_01340 [Actinobacteria bacterium SCGC AG-212-D09]|nr:hypothetical protein AYO39_01340 [Actinobacteria bacterium SCGC AG-212-D09]
MARVDIGIDLPDGFTLTDGQCDSVVIARAITEPPGPSSDQADWTPVAARASAPLQQAMANVAVNAAHINHDRGVRKRPRLERSDPIESP